MKFFYKPGHFFCFLSLLLASGLAHSAIELAIEANPGPVQPNETAFVQISIGNSGNTISGPLVLQLVYPSHLNQITDGPHIDGGDCPNTTCSTGEVVVWQLGLLPSGSSRTVSLPTVVTNGTASGTSIPFFVEIFQNNIKVGESTRTVTVQNTPAFDIAVDEDVSQVQSGGQLVYTITYSNRNSANSTNTTLNVPLPQGVSFVSASGGGALNGNVVEWNLNTLPAHMGGQQEVTVDVNNAVASGTFLEMDNAEITGTVNFLQQSSQATAVTPVSNANALVLAMELNPYPAQPNETLNTALTVSNTGNSALSGVTLELRYPEHLNQVSDGANIDDGDCANSTCSSREIVVWQIGNLPAGASRTLTLPPIVTNGTLPGTLINLNARVREDNGARAALSRTVWVQNTPPFDIAVTENVNPAQPGASLVYTVTYANRNSASATNTSLRLPLPQGVSFVSASNSGTLNGNVVEWNLNTLPAQTGGEQKVTVNVGNAVVPGTALKIDKGQIKGTVNFLPQSSQATAVTTVSNSSPLVLSMELNPAPVQQNETLNTTLMVSNTSNSALFGVTLELRYPEHLNQVSDGPNIDGGDCANTTCSKNEIATWQFGTLPAGASRTATLPPLVSNGTIPGTLINLNARVQEDDGTRAAQSRAVWVQNSPPFDLAVDEDVNPVGPGEPLMYTVTYANRSALNSTNTSLRLPLPQGASFVSASNGGVLNGNVVEWNLNTLPAQTGGEQKVTVNVGNAVPLGTVLEIDKAEIKGTVNFLQRQAHALAATAVSNNNSMLLAMVLNPDPVLANGMLNSSLILSNITNAALFGVTLELRYPEHLNQVSDGPNIDGGDCANTTCSTNEIVTWQIGTLNSGATQVLTLPPIVSNGTIPGTLISFNAKANEDNNVPVRTSDTAFVGTNYDSDGDSFIDALDNCINVPNANQRDSDNDNFGNSCDCDLNNDFIVNVLDLNAFRSVFGSNNAHADFNGDTVVNVLDLNALRRHFGGVPGPSGTAP